MPNCNFVFNNIFVNFNINFFIQPAPAPRFEEEHNGFDLVKVMHDLFTDRQDRAISNEDENADEAVKKDDDARPNLTPVSSSFNLLVHGRKTK